MAQKSQVTVVATLYQAGNSLYDLFDKVLVLDAGKQIYYGPGRMAKTYFEDLGFVCPPGVNTADFLTSVTVPTERQVKPGTEKNNPAELYRTRSHL
jgi:ABC-type multidrug transport system ATPase subunit